MTNSRTTKKALLSSALALTMCVAMLLATTFAWFTDTASSSVNKIQAGTLDVKIEYANNATGTGGDATWTEVETDTPLKFLQKSGESDTAAPATDTILWDPGSTWENSYTGGTVIIDGAKVYDENTFIDDDSKENNNNDDDNNNKKKFVGYIKIYIYIYIYMILKKDKDK